MHVRVQVGHWCDVLTFNIVEGATKTILGYGGLKSGGLTVHCASDIIQDEKGQMYMCHAVDTGMEVEEGYVVHVKLREIHRERVMQTNARLQLPLGKSMVLGPYQTRKAILPYKVTEFDLQMITSMFQIPNLLVNTAYRMSGEICLHIHNVGRQARLISQKAILAAVFLQAGTHVTWYASIKFERTAQDVNVIELQDWKRKFPAIFNIESEYGKENSRMPLHIASNEIDWIVPL